MRNQFFLLCALAAVSVPQTSAINLHENFDHFEDELAQVGKRDETLLAMTDCQATDIECR